VNVASPYFEYQPLEHEIAGRVLTHFWRSALGQWQEEQTPILLLAEQVALEPDAQVLQLGCGTGLVGAVAAQAAPRGTVTLLDTHLVAVQVAQRTLQANKIANAQAALSDGGSAVHGRAFDAVLALLPKSRPSWEQAVLDAATLLQPGGRVLLAGANHAGIKSAGKFMAQIFGHAHVLAYRGGCRVLGATRGPDACIPPSEYDRWDSVSTEVGGQILRYASKPGLFSWRRLDAGSRLLIEALQAHPLDPRAQVLDIGCGGGVLTLAAALQAPLGRTLGVDVDCRAIEATRRTLAMNGVTHAEARLSDCGEAIRGSRFSVVISNPPFHRAQATTYAIAEQIVRDAGRLLHPRGRLYLVANTFLRYQPTIEQFVGPARQLLHNRQYTVWYAEKPA
jgi:16S rRNA (guanine1207-N2)-methyltransferase